MTGSILAALAVFVAGHGDQLTPKEYEKSITIYERYYTGSVCNAIVGEKSGKYVTWECDGLEPDEWEDDFYIVFDLKNQTRERHRKTTLLWLYAKQRYESTK